MMLHERAKVPDRPNRTEEKAISRMVRSDPRSKKLRTRNRSPQQTVISDLQRMGVPPHRFQNVAAKHRAAGNGMEVKIYV